VVVGATVVVVVVGAAVVVVGAAVVVVVGDGPKYTALPPLKEHTPHVVIADFIAWFPALSLRVTNQFAFSNPVHEYEAAPPKFVTGALYEVPLLLPIDTDEYVPLPPLKLLTVIIPLVLAPLHVAAIVKLIGANVVVVVVGTVYNALPTPEQSEFASPISSIVAAKDFDIVLLVALVPCASNVIEGLSEFINCLGCTIPSHSVHSTYE
jgi:hypothetical protein